ncbi:MAG: hypothetical protein NWQ38_09080 [Cellulophaga sp.]|nr:hypothetical protein [Cellulophaga sp.]
MKDTFKIYAVLILVLISCAEKKTILQKPSPANVIVILVGDAGYIDFGFKV